MAKPTTYASLICTILMLIAGIMAFLGLKQHSALLIVIGLLPTVAYEVYRTEGESTRASSIILLLILVAELIFIIFGINFDLAAYLGQSDMIIGGSVVPLGDLKVLAPALMALMSIILFTRTAGIYTKWLSVIIFAVSFVLIYVISPAGFSALLKSAMNQVVFWGF